MTAKQTKTEQVLRQSEAFFRALFELSPDSVVLIDPHDPKVSWPIIDCNQATCLINGYSRDELIGHSIDILNVSPGTPADRSAYIKQLREAGKLNFEVLHRRKDGSLFPVEVSTTIFTVGGRELVLGIDRDITARKQAEATVQESQARFEGIVSMAVEAIISIDEDQRIILFNQAAEKIFGYSAAEVLGSPLVDLLPLASAEMHPRLVQGFGESEGDQSRPMNQHSQVQGRRRGGELFEAEVNISKVNVGGKVVHTAIVRDITERSQAEEAIKAGNAELAMLFELSHSLAEADSLEAILKLVNRHAVESVHCTFARIAVLENGKYIWRSAYPIRPLAHELGIGEQTPPAAFPFSQRLLEKKEAVVLRANDPTISADEKKILSLDLAQSACLIPLSMKSKASSASGELIGLLMLGETRNESREPFREGKIRLAQAIGDTAVVAIRRMLLHEQTERNLQQLAALATIDRAISSTFDLQISLGVLLQQASTLLKVDASDVLLFNPGTNTLEFSVGRGFRFKIPQRTQVRLGEGYAGQVALKREIIYIRNLAEQNDNARLDKYLENEQIVSYLGVPLVTKGKLKGVLGIFQRAILEPDKDWLDFLNNLAGQAAIAIDSVMQFDQIQQSNNELFRAYDETIEGWSHALDLRDRETEGHTQRVTELTLNLARKFLLSEEELVQVRRGALLHDIGKMGVPDGILLKPGPLTDEEWAIMRKHPTFAYELLSPIHYLYPAIDIPYCHHEKWDGSGYPRGLRGEQIPLVARIFAVVDVWDALTSDRVYRAAWPKEKVLEHIRSLAGTHFDPEVVKTCLESGLLEGK